MIRTKRLPWAALAAATTLAALSSLVPARAGAVRVSRDRSDNTLGFTYDSVAGLVTVLTSSTRIGPEPDPVRFDLILKNKPDAPEGRRLRAIVRLRLRGNKPHRYAGHFRFVVRDEDGKRVVRRSKTRHITLTRDDRTAGPIRFRFDVPTGEDYSAHSRFVPLKS